jgi:hypothetical protein
MYDNLSSWLDQIHGFSNHLFYRYVSQCGWEEYQPQSPGQVTS